MPKSKNIYYNVARRVIAAALALTITIVTCVCAIASGTASMYDCGFTIRCDAFYMVNIDSDTDVIRKNSTKQVGIASVTKLMTGILVMEAIDCGDLSLDTVVTTTLKEVQADDTYLYDSTSLLTKGKEEITIEQLLNCMLIASKNETANILARVVAQTKDPEAGIENFVAMMNAKAGELGLEKTSFINPSGLTTRSGIYNKSTAEEVVVMFKELITYETARDILSTPTYSFKTNLGKYTINTTNYLLDSSTCPITDGYKYKYDCIKGGKTGTTSAAGACFTSYAEKNGMTYICVALGGERESKYTTNYALHDTREAYIWAFDNLSVRPIVDTTRIAAEVPVSLSFESEHVSLVPAQEVYALVPNDFDITLLQKRFDPAIEDISLSAPIDKGTIISRMDLLFDGDVIGSVDVVAEKDIAKSVTLGAVETLEHFFGTTGFKIVIGVAAGLLIVYLIIVLIVNIRRRRKGKRNSTIYRRGYKKGKRYR